MSVIIGGYQMPSVTNAGLVLRMFHLLGMINGYKHCYKDVDFNSIPGERYLSVFAVVSNVGIQRCLRECISRKPNCMGVNFLRKQLQCEMSSFVNYSELSVEYIRINLEEIEENAWCISCPEGQKCVHLSSNAPLCVDDEDYLTDCTSIHHQNSLLGSGEYTIKLPHKEKIRVYCEMEADGGGWTVFQRRTDGSVNFTRNWTEYRNGFGNISSEFWIGNANLFKILRYGRYEMRMDMGDFEGKSRYIKYSHINLGDEDTMFTIHLSGYSGDIWDCFTQNNGINGMQFSTFDQDNDPVSSRSCAINYPAGWWFNSCHCANPNGLYLKGETDIWAKGITYAHWRGNNYSMKYTRMMVRRVL